MHDFAFSDTLRVFIALLAIVNPFGAVPIFVAVTADQTSAQRLRTSKVTALAVGIALLVGAYLGQYILDVFGIDLDAFRVGGGLLIMLMAIQMLQGHPNAARHTTAETQEGVSKDDVAVVPLAIPLLAGPGSLSTVIIAAQSAHGWLSRLLLGGGIILVAVIVYFTLRVAVPLSARLGESGIRIATRILGLLLAAIAVQFISLGLKGLLPGLAG
ncbi:MarC family protein [Acidihalobacter ferrooxydans]|uniref:UPF0056 membrane protein n=1 Tax=Acidihalobacter ferrooxydans TaxID=1765967 RepID=A0A1P8UKP1_9GAMM|nr:MarC family protein [Acidihalobacter ferrooxydans]APZ44389.1 amino acid transporter [Acidihalobacter ferrooxydans]